MLWLTQEDLEKAMINKAHNTDEFLALLERLDYLKTADPDVTMAGYMDRPDEADVLAQPAYPGSTRGHASTPATTRAAHRAELHAALFSQPDAAVLTPISAANTTAVYNTNSTKRDREDNDDPNQATAPPLRSAINPASTTTNNVNGAPQLVRTSSYLGGMDTAPAAMAPPVVNITGEPVTLKAEQDSEGEEDYFAKMDPEEREDMIKQYFSTDINDCLDEDFLGMDISELLDQMD